MLLGLKTLSLKFPQAVTNDRIDQVLKGQFGAESKDLELERNSGQI